MINLLNTSFAIGFTGSHLQHRGWSLHLSWPPDCRFYIHCIIITYKLKVKWLYLTVCQRTCPPPFWSKKCYISFTSIDRRISTAWLPICSDSECQQTASSTTIILIDRLRDTTTSHQLRRARLFSRWSVCMEQSAGRHSRGTWRH